MIVGQVDPSIPVYQILRESGSGDVKTVHRNLLLPLSLPLDPLHVQGHVISACCPNTCLKKCNSIVIKYIRTKQSD